MYLSEFMPEPIKQGAGRKPVTSPSLDTHSKDLLQESQRLYSEGKLGEALLVVGAISKAPELADALSNQRLVLEIILNGRRHEFGKVGI